MAKKNPSPMQRRLAHQLSDVVRGKSPKRTTKEILLQAGYSETIANKPSVITHSQGVQLALKELGLTKELVIDALRADIESKPGRRAFELSIAGKWLGLEQRQDAPTNNGTTIQNAVIIIKAPDSGSTKPPLDHN